MKTSDQLDKPAGNILPLLPKANPLGENPNPWQYHSSGMPIFKLVRPIEVEFEDGTRRVLNIPKHYENIAKLVRFWRWHHVPEKMEHYIKFVWHRKFTFWDRLRILFAGKNLVVPIAVACRNSPGNCQPVAIGYLTKSTDADQFMQNELKLATARYLKETAKEVTNAAE
jgi:hypothetical protein